MAMPTGKDMGKAADLLLQVWNDPNKKLASLPDDLRPGNLAHAYGIQQAVSQGLGAIGGWTIWRSVALNSLVCAPLPLASIHPSPTCLASGHWTYRRLVPRICFRLGTCLPDYDAPATWSLLRLGRRKSRCRRMFRFRSSLSAEEAWTCSSTAMDDGSGRPIETSVSSGRAGASICKDNSKHTTTGRGSATALSSGDQSSLI